MNAVNEEQDCAESVPAVIVVPPFFPHTAPSLAAGILKAGLKERGINSKVLYANLLFIQTAGSRLYEQFLGSALDNFLFESLFAAFAHKGLKEVSLKQLNAERVPSHLHRFYKTAGRAHNSISEDQFAAIKERAEIFIEETADKITSLCPRIVGFSSTLQQINSSIALAKAIKQRSPDTICVIGGNNCDGEMGEELSSSIKVFDYVFQGEADTAFADFCHDYLKNNILPAEKLIRCPATHDLNSLPVPDHSDFFEQSIVPPENVMLSFESSRGCWWGHKKQCKFCGESYINIRYRHKSPERMFKELNQLYNKYSDTHSFFATDAIFPYSYFKSLLPELALSGFRKKMVYQSRANLTSDQIAAMKEIGIDYIFPGIESLSSRLLKIMNKGTDALMNICFLRNCRELDVSVNWLMLIGIPGDRVTDYEEQSSLIPFIQHLPPPSMNPMRIHRFSPYFTRAEADSITNIRPISAYKYAFPESVDISRIAYYFDAEYPSESREQPEILSPLRQKIEEWLKRWGQADIPLLTVKQSCNNQWIVKDSRDCAKMSVQELSEDEYLLLKQCRAGLSLKDIRAKSLADRLIDLGYLIEVDGKLLSVVCDLSMREKRKMGLNKK